MSNRLIVPTQGFVFTLLFLVIIIIGLMLFNHNINQIIIKYKSDYNSQKNLTMQYHLSASKYQYMYNVCVGLDNYTTNWESRIEQKIINSYTPIDKI